MKTKKHKIAAEFTSWGIVLLVIGLACFCLAPIVEDLLHGWSFEYDGKLWGLYQYGYAPLGLLNVLSKGIQGLFAFIIRFNETQMVINIGGIVCLLVLILIMTLWVIMFIGACAKHKGYKSAAIIFILIFGLLGVFGVSSYIGSFDYMVKQNGVTSYCYLFTSILVNPEIKVPTLVMSIIGFGGEVLGLFLIVIGLIVHTADVFQKNQVKEEQKNVQPAPQSNYQQNRPNVSNNSVQQRPQPRPQQRPNGQYQNGQRAMRPQQPQQRPQSTQQRPQSSQNRPQQIKK